MTEGSEAQDRRDEGQAQDRRFVAMATAARRSQRTGLLLIAFLAFVIVVATSGASAWNTHQLRILTRDTNRLLQNDVALNLAAEVEKVIKAREREFGTSSVQCVLEQLGEHRHLTALAHRKDADTHGYSYPVPPEEEPPPVDPGATVCEPFLPIIEGQTSEGRPAVEGQQESSDDRVEERDSQERP